MIFELVIMAPKEIRIYIRGGNEKKELGEMVDEYIFKI